MTYEELGQALALAFGYEHISRVEIAGYKTVRYSNPDMPALMCVGSIDGLAAYVSFGTRIERDPDYRGRDPYAMSGDIVFTNTLEQGYFATVGGFVPDDALEPLGRADDATGGVISAALVRGRQRGLADAVRLEAAAVRSGKGPIYDAPN